MKTTVYAILGFAYQIAAWATFGKLTFFDQYIYTWWNWIFVIPCNIFLSQLWPIYWGLIRPFFGK